jgi:excinuclease ABC subunit C
VWQSPRQFSLTSSVSLDSRLRELVASLDPVSAPLAEKPEHLALLARWHYSSWSDGEWIGFRGWDEAPYRKLVRAISRVRQKADNGSTISNAKK